MDQQTLSIETLEQEIHKLKQQLVVKEKLLNDLKKEIIENPYCDKLTAEDVTRYSRQIILPEVAVDGQIKLKNSKVLVVGAGGLGCPASLYLAAAGVGHITIIDSDEVELTNLHRQILHSEITIGLPKVESATISLNRLNSSVVIKPLKIHLTSSNIIDLLKEFDVVVDATDNVATRYLLNDACVIQNKPLVFGSALKFEGQLTVYHYKGGPCYRCLFPVPPPPETVTSCGDGGVLGCVPGIIGILQALETIKIILNMSDILSGKLLLFDGSNSTFRNVSLRKRSSHCAVCGNTPTVISPIDYEQFCQANAHDKGDMIQIISSDERISVQDYNKVVNNKINHVLLDVRSKSEFEMCRLPNSINVPLTDIEKNLHVGKINSLTHDVPVFLLCRRGNDSQRAVKILKEQFQNVPLEFKDIIGGLHAYSTVIDHRFPIY